jgi:hypothetical protein
MSEIDEGLRMSWHASAGRMCAELQKLQKLQNQLRIWTEGQRAALVSHPQLFMLSQSLPYSTTPHHPSFGELSI